MFLESQTISAKHGFFGRECGFSSGLFSSLNCGLGSGDDIEIVKKNRDLVLEKIGGKKLITLKQCHSDIAVIVNDEINAEADALVTDKKGIALGVLTADCAPVLLYDAKAGIIGAAHAGWRGARFGIISSVVRAMQNMGARDINAVIGPCIQQQSYEVGQEFFDVFAKESPKNQKFFIRATKPEKFMFNLPAYVKKQLEKSEVSQVEALEQDTFWQPEKYFSFRRTTLAGEKQYGRQISVICL